MEHEQCLFGGCDTLDDDVIPQIVEKLLTDGERPASELHLGLPRRLDLFDRRLEDAGDVRWIGRGPDGRNRTDFRDLTRDGEHGSSAE